MTRDKAHGRSTTSATGLPVEPSGAVALAGRLADLSMPDDAGRPSVCILSGGNAD